MQARLPRAKQFMNSGRNGPGNHGEEYRDWWGIAGL